MSDTDILTITPEAVDLAVMRAVAELAPHAGLDDIRDRASASLGANIPRRYAPDRRPTVGSVLDRLTERGLVAPFHYHEGRAVESLTDAGHALLQAASN